MTATPDSLSRGAGFRVLLVEDSAPVARIFALLLEKLGHEVQVATDGDAALEKIRECHPEIIFSDIAMPGMSGYEFAQQIRAVPDWKNIVLVALTGYSQEEDRQHALDSGFDLHLTKPADLSHLDEVFDLAASKRTPSR